MFTVSPSAVGSVKTQLLLKVQDKTCCHPKKVQLDRASSPTFRVANGCLNDKVSKRARPRHASGMETAPFARLRLRVFTLDSVSSSPCSSDFLSAMLARKRNVTESHSSGSSRSRKPRQMMQVAARRTTLKMTSCFKTSMAVIRKKKERGGVKTNQITGGK